MQVMVHQRDRTADIVAHVNLGKLSMIDLAGPSKQLFCKVGYPTDCGQALSEPHRPTIKARHDKATARVTRFKGHAPMMLLHIFCRCCIPSSALVEFDFRHDILAGMRMIEGANINRSLLALGNCITALSSAVAFVPYRASNLTSMLEVCWDFTGF